MVSPITTISEDICFFRSIQWFAMPAEINVYAINMIDSALVSLLCDQY